MLIGLDSRELARADVRGIGRYAWHLLDAMRTVAPEVRWRLFYDADSPAPALPAGCPAELAPLRFRGDRWRLWEQIALPFSAAASGVDLLHAPASFAPALQLSPTVITLHDTIAWDRFDGSDPGRRFLFTVLPRALRAARRIITISQHSRRDIVRRFPFTRNKIRVIHHGLDDRFLAPADPDGIAQLRQQLGLRRPYVLYVGGSVPRKRADWAVRLLAEWVTAGQDLDLALLGLACQPTEPVLALAQSLGVRERVHVLPYLSADQLPSLYAGSELVVYPTLYEGFGFPALEAQAMGKVILMGRTSSLLELAGSSAQLLDCEDFPQWSAAGLRWLEAPDERAGVREAARQWAQGFRWERAARQTWCVYQEALNGAA